MTMTTTGSPARLMTGAEYKASLDDGRRVFYRGELIDVTTHPLTAPGIEWQASLYDAQHSEELKDVLTVEREDGGRMSTAWLVPRTAEDLDRKREATEWIAWHTLATMGRTPDMLPWCPIGQLAYFERFAQLDPEHSENLETYFEYASGANLHLGGVLIEPQGTAARAAKAGEDREAVMHVVEENEHGIRIRGAKAVGTYGPQAHELIVGSIYYPHLRPEEAFWCAIPVASEGLSFVCRERVSDPDASRFDHPVTSRGEEVDAFVLFEDVFVPWDRVWSYRTPELSDPMLYGATGAGEQWQLLTHLTVKAELLAGLTQLIVDTLEIGQIPAVADQAGRIFQYAQLLRNGVIAGQELARPTPNGILMPHGSSVAAARSFALEEYPKIVHMVQELCGQGLVMRFSDADFSSAELKPLLSRYLDTATCSARYKNVLMNAAWDLTTSASAGRTALFENVNGLPAAFLRQKLFFTYDRAEHAERVATLVGLPDADD
jgi:4-hydroxyphenylacetate 3-monooxygenase